MSTIAQNAAQPGGYQAEKMTFPSDGSEIVGTLFLPHETGKRAPGAVILGPFGFVKEQSPAQYATQLVGAGFAVLIFDPRYSGESGGTPRRLESPAAKIADTSAAIGALAARPDIDANRLCAVGICQGASEMIALAAADTRIKVLATVTGNYLYRANIVDFFSGGGPTLDQRIARGRAAKAKFEASGEVEYTPVVSQEDKTVGLPWPPIYDWYHPWTTAKWGEPSRWENRYATMSDAEVWTFDVDVHAARLMTPTIMIHGEKSDGFVASVQHVYDRVPARDKRLVIVPGVFHTRFYDDPLVIAPAATEVAAWFYTHLA